jgi:hypothetical protein
MRSLLIKFLFILIKKTDAISIINENSTDYNIVEMQVVEYLNGKSYIEIEIKTGDEY